MPAKSEKQRKFMGAELARKRAGKKTKTGMSEGQLQDYSRKGLKARGKRIAKRTAATRKKGVAGQPAKRAKSGKSKKLGGRGSVRG